jgi:hypothetical protein
MISIKINSADVQSYLSRIQSLGGQVRPFLMRWANAIAKEARDTARAKGGKRFWRQIAAATRVKAISDSTVEIANWHVAGAQKQYGGPIEAKNAKALTIPIAPEAHGKRAADFTTGGRQLFVPKGTSVLGYADATGFHALFALRKRVMQKPEPWFPATPRITLLGDLEANRYITDLLRG